MLTFISYAMENEADRGSFLWEFCTMAHGRSSLWGFTEARILHGSFSNHYFLTLRLRPIDVAIH